MEESCSLLCGLAGTPKHEEEQLDAKPLLDHRDVALTRPLGDVEFLGAKSNGLHTDVRRRLLLQRREKLIELGSGGPGIIFDAGDQDPRVASCSFGKG